MAIFSGTLSQNLKKNISKVKSRHREALDIKITKVKAWKEMQLSNSIIENIMYPLIHWEWDG